MEENPGVEKKRGVYPVQLFFTTVENFEPLIAVSHLLIFMMTLGGFTSYVSCSLL